MLSTERSQSQPIITESFNDRGRLLFLKRNATEVHKLEKREGRRDQGPTHLFAETDVVRAFQAALVELVADHGLRQRLQEDQQGLRHRVVTAG